MELTGSFYVLFPVYCFFVILGTGLISVAAHELGHAFAGKVSGYRVSGLKFPWASLSFGEGEVRLRRSGKGVKGQCLIYDAEGRYDRRAGAAVLGGSLLNLLISGLCALMLPACSEVYGLTACMTGAVINLFFGVSNLIPKGSNDGATFAEIMRFGSENYNKLMNIASAKEQGRSLKDMNPEWFVPSTVGGSMAVELKGLMCERRQGERGDRRYGG